MPIERDISKLDERTQEAVKNFKDPNASIYPYLKGKTTVVGHRITYDETPGNENIEIRHGKSGAEVFLAPNGDVYIRSPGGDVNVTAARNSNILVGSNLDIDQKDNSDRMNINVVGNAHILVEGDTHFHTKGDRYDLVDGSYTLTVGNKTNIISPDMGIECEGNYIFEGNSIEVNGSTITTKCDVGGEVVFDLFGSFVVNQLLPKAGTISFQTGGNMEINVGQNFDVIVTDSMDIKCLGVGFSATKPAFSVECALGGISMKALLGNAEMFSVGKFDIDCVTGIYLN